MSRRRVIGEDRNMVGSGITRVAIKKAGRPSHNVRGGKGKGVKRGL